VLFDQRLPLLSVWFQRKFQERKKNQFFDLVVSSYIVLFSETHSAIGCVGFSSLR
jgi:hypothetical protein